MSDTLNAYNLSQSIVEKLSSFVNYGISSQKVSQLAFLVMFVVSLILEFVCCMVVVEMSGM